PASERTTHVVEQNADVGETMERGRRGREGGTMAREQRLTEVFVELADTLVEEFDVVDFLQTLSERCVELVDTDAAGLMLDDQRGNLQLIAHTHESARLLELFELQKREGPCLDCFAT